MREYGDPTDTTEIQGSVVASCGRSWFGVSLVREAMWRLSQNCAVARVAVGDVKPGMVFDAAQGGPPGISVSGHRGKATPEGSSVS